ncbi:MAG: DUF962 domain-containing protein [Planctomycetes bacterium]|nr:DUF962 domain-containing protein [Planctomycetota bacterium]
MPAWLSNWRERHQHPASLLLHALAIPMLPMAVVLIVVQLADSAWNLWWRPLGLIVVSYVMQWLGHRIEGNEMGEVVLIKKLLGKPYVAVAPRYAARAGGGASPAEMTRPP